VERDRLSSDLDFEGAARQHEKVTKVKGIASSCSEIYRGLDQIDAVIVQPASQPESVALFRFSHGELAGPEYFSMEARDDAPPVEARLRETLPKLVLSGARSLQQFTEELAILKRWYYRTHKTGEIFFANHQGELPVRRISNAVQRVFRGEKETADPPASENSSVAQTPE